MPIIKFQEGDWFAVPLRDSGFALGVVARKNPKGVLLGYFFGPRLEEVPNLDAVGHLDRADALRVQIFGDLSLRSGDWPLLGHMGTWDRDAWPMPVFGRIEELTGRAFRVHYDPDDPAEWLHDEQRLAADALRLPADILAGAGWVELRLTRLLAADRGAS